MGKTIKITKGSRLHDSCGKNRQLVVDSGTCFTIVRPDIVKHCKFSDTGAKFILETAGGDTMPVLGIHEAKI